MPASAPLAALAGPALRLQTDARLVTLTREGHGRAFEEIVRRYRTPLVRFAGAIVPADRAEDVVQEAFTRAHAAITAGDSELALRPWLYRVVRNGALNDLRDHRTHEELDPEYDGVPQPPDIASRSEELATTVAAISALPAAQRDALVKRELEGMGHDEIAADLGVSPGAVRQLIFRARTALRNGLGSLIPLPVIRAMLEAGPAGAGAAGTAVGGGAAALGIAGGGGIALKAGTAALVALAIGSGVALRDDHRRAAEAATVASADEPGARHAHGHDGRAGPDGGSTAPQSGEGRSAHGRGGTGDDGGDDRDGDGGHSGPGGGSGSDSSGPGGSGHSGPGGGDDGGDSGSSGPGGGGDGGGGDNSGPGGGGDTGGGDNSGPGGGDDVAEPEEDHSGPGGGDDDLIETERRESGQGDAPSEG